jgi:hypothetical protein
MPIPVSTDWFFLLAIMSRNKKGSAELLKKYNIYYRNGYIFRSIILANVIALNTLFDRNQTATVRGGVEIKTAVNEMFQE